jgi:hypothetical protein
MPDKTHVVLRQVFRTSQRLHAVTVKEFFRVLPPRAMESMIDLVADTKRTWPFFLVKFAIRAGHMYQALTQCWTM